MKIKINHKKLTDSPYDGDTTSIFKFTDIEVEKIVNDLTKLKESCYYISGYRGAGKTSFIVKTEEELKKQTNDENFVFVHVSISKFEKYEILIRDLIRQFHYQFIEKGIYKKGNLNVASVHKLADELTTLNKQTFYNISHETSKIDRTEKNKSFKYNIDITKIALLILSFLSLMISFIIDLDFICPCFTWISRIGSSIWAIAQSFQANLSFTRTETTIAEDKENEKSFYDDDVAEYKFKAILRKFKELPDPKMKLIFVIDELDKLSLKDAKRVLHLFKSTLLCGYANFIVVGGQKLFYELDLSDETEDGILNTLFSNTYHIKLKSGAELRALFDQVILANEELTDAQNKTKYEEYVNSLIIESRRIPRKFINLIKAELQWEKDANGNTYAYIAIPETNLTDSTNLVNAMDEASDMLSTTGKIPDAIRDFILMIFFREKYNLTGFNSIEEFEHYITTIISPHE